MFKVNLPILPSKHVSAEERTGFCDSRIGERNVSCSDDWHTDHFATVSNPQRLSQDTMSGMFRVGPTSSVNYSRRSCHFPSRPSGPHPAAVQHFWPFLHKDASFRRLDRPSAAVRL
ncbi:hypothetical protein VZT92_003611 [Zoarces viviparus]|uniref:Uncharacterized protein n=1 Tax=Zoarces viviparus TaxID=48416 RepID=A0AAW1FU26_ZOAVI